jgi:uncharacterized protein (DUF924 family)
MDSRADDSVTVADVLSFWFEAHGPKDWFGGEKSFDAAVIEGFATTHAKAVANELVSWRSTPEGRLAEIIVLDQFSRQIHRRHPRAFAADGQALALAQEMVLRGDDLKIEEGRRLFAYMPYMHSESRAVQDDSVRLFSVFDDETRRYADEHRALIVRFGRYPHRNATLGRESSAAEREHLAGNHESYGQ